jgi:hypothetical protein
MSLHSPHRGDPAHFSGQRPKRELPVWGDEELRTSLLRGMVDFTQGRVARRDDLLDGDDEE